MISDSHYSHGSTFIDKKNHYSKSLAWGGGYVACTQGIVFFFPYIHVNWYKWHSGYRPVASQAAGKGLLPSRSGSKIPITGKKLGSWPPFFCPLLYPSKFNHFFRSDKAIKKLWESGIKFQSWERLPLFGVPNLIPVLAKCSQWYRHSATKILKIYLCRELR